jgi:hypothetical protein
MNTTARIFRFATCLGFSTAVGCASSNLAPPVGEAAARASAFPTTQASEFRLTGRGLEHGSPFANSWVAPEAKTEDLLYVGGNNDYLSLYSYPRGKLVGVINNPNFSLLSGECVDGKGNVYVTSLANGKVFEYPHGSKKLIQTINMSSGDAPVDCSVDPTSGDLAITSLGTGTRGNVSIFKPGHKSPMVYVDRSIYYYFFCSYDAESNLYIDGQAKSPETFELAVLPRGSAKFTNISLNQSIGWPGSVLWDGKHLAVGDQTAPDVYEFNLSGSTGTLENTTPINGIRYDNAFWIQGKRILVTNGGGTYQSIDFFAYPAGGNATKSITKDVAGPGGLTVSLANQ